MAWWKRRDGRGIDHPGVALWLLLISLFGTLLAVHYAHKGWPIAF